MYIPKLQYKQCTIKVWQSVKEMQARVTFGFVKEVKTYLNWTLKTIEELPGQKRKKKKAYFRQMKQSGFEKKDAKIVKQ